MVKRESKSGPQHSTTLLKGKECLWLGFHKNIVNYISTPITSTIFQQRALRGHIGTITQAGLYGAEVEFPVESAKGFARLNISVEELLPMTSQQANELRESISNVRGDMVSIQTKANSQMVSTNTKQNTYECVEKGCSFSSPSPQGLGTHRVKTHNLQPQKRSNGRKVLIMKTKVEVVKPVSNITEKVVSTGTTIKATSNTSNDWKARHDAVMKRYNRLSIRYDTVMKVLKKLSDS